jgi:site-specific recombinase XerD
MNDDQTNANSALLAVSLVRVEMSPDHPLYALEQQQLNHADAVAWCVNLRTQCASAAAHDGSLIHADNAVAFDMTLEQIERTPKPSYTIAALIHLAKIHGLNSDMTPEQRRFLSEVRTYRNAEWTPERVAAFRQRLEREPAYAGALFRYVFYSFMDPVNAYLDSLGTDVSRTGMRQSLRTVYQLLDIEPEPDSERSSIVAWFWFTFSAARMIQIRSLLVEHPYKSATVNHVLSAVRGVVNQMWTLGYIAKDDAERICSVRNVAHHIDEPTGREITLEEMRTILFRCTLDVTDPIRGAAAFRDAALLSLLWSTGIRRQEIALLSVSSVDIVSGEIHVYGKGNKPRTVFVAGGALEALTAWFSHRPLFNDGTEPAQDAPLFPNIDRWGCVGTRHMSPESINRIVTRRYKDAGVQPLTPHDFRRTFVGNMLTAGVDIRTVSGICGHNSVLTTARYDRRKNEPRRNAAALVLTPYGA